MGCNQSVVSFGEDTTKQDELKSANKKKNTQYENEYVSGLLACDGCKEKRTIKDSLCFIWLLNLASAYRDMMVDDVYKSFDLSNHTPQSYWMMGCCGPFGIIDFASPGTIIFPILNLDKRVNPKQHDDYNYGVIWCLFVHDIMQQALVPYDFKFDVNQKQLIPVTAGIGKTWISPSIYSHLITGELQVMDDTTQARQMEHEILLYQVFREKILVLLGKVKIFSNAKFC